MIAPAIHIVLELERTTAAWLVSFDLGDEVRLLDALEARGRERLESEVLAALAIGIEVLQARTAKATAADVWRRAA